MFIAVARGEMRKQIAAVTDHGKFIADAPVFIAVFCRKDEKYYLEDGAAATQNILVAATAHGVGYPADDGKRVKKRSLDEIMR